MKKKKKQKIKNLHRKLAYERHERIITELMYERAISDLTARTPMGFKVKKQT